MPTYRRTSALLIRLALLPLAVAMRAQGAPLDFFNLEPSTVFVQAGAGDQSTSAYLAGATWDWAWHRDYKYGTLGGYFELAGGRWTTSEHGFDRSSWMTQVGLTPVFRFRPSGSLTPWFAEVGVGANYILPIFQSGYKRFSTEFNFGDHLAVGRTFGDRAEHELAVRVEHFSNAGIAHPNPGENFLQLRYSYRL
jgi:lipid A 3-O-deacylase